MHLYEVFLVPGAHPASEEVLSPEVLDETKAQVMTPEQAETVGFHGIPEDPQGRPRLFIACGETDGRMVQTRLEASNLVAQYRLHYVDG